MVRTSAVQDQRATLPDLTTATRLEELLRASPLAVGDVFDLMENLTAIHSLGIAPISGLAVKEWERLLRFTRELGVGETRYDGEDREWLLARRLYKDYVLVDSRVYYQVQPPSRRWGDDASGSAVVETMLSVRQPEVEFARDYFEQLWKLAEGSG
jgi:hypothetical protein